MNQNKFVVAFNPKSNDQKRAIQLYKSHDLLFLLGPAGCGKSHTAFALALSDIQSQNKKKIIFTRPIIETKGEELGFLPGDVDEKTEPYRQYLNDILPRIAFHLPKDIIEFIPLAYMRGRSFEDCVIVVGEAQNCTYLQLKLILTRIGKNSKIIIEGDPDQSDLPSDGDDLLDVVERLENERRVAVVDFDEEVNLRHPLVATVLRKL